MYPSHQNTKHDANRAKTSEGDGGTRSSEECSIDTNDRVCYNLIADIVKERSGCDVSMTADEDYIFLKKKMREAMRGKTEEEKAAILAKKLSEIEDDEKDVRQRRKKKK